jgi:hypothetical protein
VFAQRFDAVGSAVGDETQLNRSTAGDQGDVALAGDGHGGLLAAWASAGQDGDGLGIYTTAVSAGAAGQPPSGSPANGIDVAVIGASTSEVLSYSIAGGDVTITTAAGTQYFLDVERIRFEDALFALDTQAPGAGAQGGSVWQAAALLWAGLGWAPGVSLLSQWTAQADHVDDMGDLGQALIDFYAAGVSSELLVAHIYATLAHAAPSEDIVQSLAGQIGAGLQFETQGDFFAAAAGLAVNTDHFAELVGSVQQLDMSWFAG